VGAAVLFGLTTPIVRRAGVDSGAFTTAGLLYFGAALATLGRRSAEAPVRRIHGRRLAAIALLGAVVAPAAFAWGLRHTSGTSAALLLNLEAAFTILLGRRLYREWVGPRVAVAVLLMVAGGAVLVVAGHGSELWFGAGAAAVALATLAWALDNALTRPLADLDPVQVVRWKAGLGASLSAVLVVATNAERPTWPHALTLIACGITGYGLSLRLYLRAQREIGAGRTASIFAAAPFIGVATAWAMGDHGGGTSTALATALFAIAVVLHVTEKHEHRHRHEPIEHEHAHRHDDGHHDHVHDPPVEGEHSHLHAHDAREHTHPHGADIHHAHDHG